MVVMFAHYGQIILLIPQMSPESKSTFYVDNILFCPLPISLELTAFRSKQGSAGNTL